MSVFSDVIGGSPTDYQILEAVGPVDEAPLIAVVLHEVGKGVSCHMRGTSRETAEFWSQGNTVQVRRMAPNTAAGEKVPPLHIQSCHLIGQGG